MRHLRLLVIGVLASFSATAQDYFSGEEIETFRHGDGHFTLVDGRKGEGVIYYEPFFYAHVNVEWPSGQKAEYAPHQIISFTVGNKWFISTSETAQSPSPSNSGYFTGDFVQVVDTGKVIMVRRYSQRPVQGGAPRISSVLLVRRKADMKWSRIPHGINSSSKKFRTAVAPYFEGRADLLEALENKTITIENFERCVKAYNSGELMNFSAE